jgi:SAM-dependent methyltransferase
MEPGEYRTLFDLEESYWWYQGLHRLVEREVRQARSRAAANRHRIPDDPGTTPSTIATTSTPRILDAGCGTGGMARRLAAFGCVFGLDWSPLALELARRRGPFRWTRGSVECLPYRSESFDLVISLDVLYHRGVRSDLEALREFRRCLRPGGTLILNLPAYESLRSGHDAAVHTARRYRRAPLRALLAEAGLEPVKVTHWNGLLFSALAAMRWLGIGRAFTGGSRGDSDLRPLPRPINRLLIGILDLERAWLRRGGLKVGLSILAVARRPSGSE